MTDLVGMTFEELEAFALSISQPAYRGRQIGEWIYKKRVFDFSGMTNLPAQLRAELKEVACIGIPREVNEQISPDDGTAKLLLEFKDGERVESVLIRHDYGNSLCVSTQVGCKMGCAFCASTLGGFRRNLSVGEIISQVLVIQSKLDGEGERISHIVIMGMGEPLDNYDSTVNFMKLVHDKRGFDISYRNITLSTCGVVPKIRELAGLKLPITLAVSLHAPNNGLRDRLVPLNRRYPLEELMAACEEYASATNRRITFEYALIDGVNDSDKEAHELVGLLSGLLSHVNLIPLNRVEERGLDRSPSGRIRSFMKILQESGVSVTLRREAGGGIDAACGQLRRRFSEKGNGL